MEIESQALEGLKNLKRKSAVKDFEAVWPEVHSAINNDVAVKNIWKALQDAGYPWSYVTFTRYVKASLEKLEKEKGENSVSQIVSKDTKQHPTLPAARQAAPEKKPDNPLETSRGFQYGNVSKDELY